MESKIVPLSDLQKIAMQARIDGKTVYFTSGGFDLFHGGHQRFLDYCRKIAGDGMLIVAICNDKILKEIKGQNRPLNSESVRAAAVAGAGEVDYVVIDTDPGFRGMLHLSVIDAIQPNYWVSPKDGLVSLKVRLVVARNRNIRMIVHGRRPPTGMPQGVSTTKIIKEYREILHELKNPSPV